MKVAIFGKMIAEDFLPSMSSMLKILRSRGVEIVVYRPFKDFVEKTLEFSFVNVDFFESCDDIKEGIDFVLSVGGDGTFLDSVMLVRDSGVPIVGFNSGRLGFLANISIDEVELAIDDIINKRYTLESRKILKVDSNTGKFSEFNYALNEFTVQKSDNRSMLTVKVYINDEYLASYWADGLIVATPTGSTAYSLSAGGPIVVPESDVMIITPISPHNLTVRPLVISSSNRVMLKVEGRSPSFVASLDSRSEVFTSRDEFVVTKADFSINVLKLNRHDFYKTLRNKLMWGADKRN